MSSIKFRVLALNRTSFRPCVAWGTVIPLLLAFPGLRGDTFAGEVCVARAPEDLVRSKGAISLAFPRKIIYLDLIRHNSIERDDASEGFEEVQFSNGTFDTLLFGPRDTETVFYRRLNSELAARVELLGRVFELTHNQKLKLLLAGKKDIENVRRRINDFKERIEEPLFVKKIDETALRAIHAWAAEVVAETTAFRLDLPDDPFLEESMLAKVLLHQLTPHQITEYEQRELKVKVVPFGRTKAASN